MHREARAALEHARPLEVRVERRHREREHRAADDVRRERRRAEEPDRQVHVERLHPEVGDRERRRRVELEHEELREEARTAEDRGADELRPLVGVLGRADEGDELAVGEAPRDEDEEDDGVDPEEDGEGAEVLPRLREVGLWR